MPAISNGAEPEADRFVVRPEAFEGDGLRATPSDAHPDEEPFVVSTGPIGDGPAGTEPSAVRAPVAEPEAEPAEAEPAGPSVLVVEDEAETREAVVSALAGACAVVAVADARAALDQMAKRRFEALILDSNLGGRQTGAEVLRIARALPGYRGVPAIALTAEADPEAAERYLGAGFERVVAAPYARNALVNALRAAGVSVQA